MLTSRILKRTALLLLVLSLASCKPMIPVPFDSTPYIEAAKKYDVHILRDTWGVPHIFGKTDADTAFGLAYAQAEDDFATLLEALFSGRGQLAAYGDWKGIPVDFMVNAMRVQKTVNEKYETEVSPEVRALCEAYADGANYFAAKHPEKVTMDFLPVTGKDIVAGFVLKTPIFYGLPGTFFDVLFKSQDDKPEKHAAVSEKRMLPEGMEIGSNTFAVGPNRSADGAARLDINSHQPWTGQVAWYEAHLHSEEGWDCVGGLFPGTPIVLHGHNRNLGWAHTVNSPDLADVYILKLNPDNKNQYEFDGEWLDFESKDVSIEVGLWGPFTLVLKPKFEWSKHGPVIRRGKKAYAIRYAGMGKVGQLEQWYRMNKARNLGEFQDALRMREITSFNIGYADKDRNIYYVYNAAMPIRAEGYDWSKPVPGNISETLWTEYYPFEKLPQVLNPESGIIQNCNSTPFQTTLGPGNPDEADYSDAWGIETKMSNRAHRALELLGGDDSITREEFELYKYDMKYSEKSKIAKAARKLAKIEPPKNLPLVKEAMELIAKWDLSTDPENTSTAIALLALDSIKDLFEDGKEPNRPKIFRCINKAALRLKIPHGRLDVPWKEVNRLKRGDVNIGMGGGNDILHAAFGLGPFFSGQIKVLGGDSYVLIVEWDKDGKVSSRSIHQFGSASTIPESPHYADQVPLFVQRKLKPVWLDEADIQANLEREYRPGEELYSRA